MHFYKFLTTVAAILLASYNNKVDTMTWMTFIQYLTTCLYQPSMTRCHVVSVVQVQTVLVAITYRYKQVHDMLICIVMI